MKKSDLSYIICSVYVSMTAIFYAGSTWFGLKLPRYYPLEHTWKWVKEKGVPSQGWYAKQIFAFLAAGIVTLVVYFILKQHTNGQTDLKSAMTKTIGMAVTFILIICMGYIMYHEFNKWGVFTSMGL